MKKNLTTLTLVAATLLLSACGESHPELTHFKAFDERFTTVLDTEDPEQLKEIAAMFYNRQDVDDVQADFFMQANCTPSDLELNANALGTDLTYSWAGPNGFVSNLESPVRISPIGSSLPPFGGSCPRRSGCLSDAF